MTTEMGVALMYAFLTTGHVYEVKPIGPLRPDGHHAWTCIRAEVVRVVRRSVELTDDDFTTIIERGRYLESECEEVGEGESSF